MTDLRLNTANLTRLGSNVTAFRYDREAVDIGIVHLGPGAFHRAHQAVYTDALLQAGSTQWGICEVSINSASVRDALSPQDNLYTLAILDEQISYQVVGAIKDFLVAPENPQKVIDTLALASVKAVTMTITEKGYCLTPEGRLDFTNEVIKHDIGCPDAPKSALGFLMAGLMARWKNDIAPFVAISCDNLTENGERLKSAAFDYADALDAAFAAWVKASVFFPCTMVDSITPATDSVVCEKVRLSTGVSDAWPIQREKFTQWVIEDLPGMELPPWDTTGAIYSDNVTGYEATKLRVLNGLHTSLAFIGLLAGLESVEQATTNTAIRTFLENTLSKEIIPTLSKVEGLDAADYGKRILRRFENPAIKHLLSQIAWDSSQKIPFRLLGTIADNLAQGRRAPHLCLSVAAWMHFVRDSVGNNTPITDPLSTRLAEIAQQCTGQPTDVDHFLQLDVMFPRALVENRYFRDDVSRAYTLLAEKKSKSIFDILTAFTN